MPCSIPIYCDWKCSTSVQSFAFIRIVLIFHVLFWARNWNVFIRTFHSAAKVLNPFSMRIEFMKFMHIFIAQLPHLIVKLSSIHFFFSFNFFSFAYWIVDCRSLYKLNEILRFSSANAVEERKKWGNFLIAFSILPSRSDCETAASELQVKSKRKKTKMN